MKALIIEDDKILSNNICESLKHKFDMAQAFDGEEGLVRLFRERFDVVILDVMMPKLNGYEVLEQMRAAGDNTPVLMLTALGQAADQVKGLRAGADDYLSKPFDLDIFQARVDGETDDTAYPENAEAWLNNCKITSRGNYVFLAVLMNPCEIPAEFILD